MKKTKKNPYKTGGKKIEITKPNQSQKVSVKGTRKSKKQSATWY